MEATPLPIPEHRDGNRSAPSPSWGRWRLEPIQMVGRTIVPAAISDEDRKTVQERTGHGACSGAKSRLPENENNERPPTN